MSLRFATPAGVASRPAQNASLGDQVISQTPFGLDAVLASTAPHVVELAVGTVYHYISRYPAPEETEPASPPACFCNSGGTCDCPGG